jgi:cobalt-zinc-cadmium efflux system membrane fusion protein
MVSILAVCPFLLAHHILTGIYMKERTLDKRRLAIAFALLLLVIVGGGAILQRLSATAAEKNTDVQHPRAEQLPQNVFRVPKEQWGNLTMESVGLQPFQPAEATDGTIATNDNTTVNVFSPYSGRVTRLNVKVGDVVRKGAPLMEVEATEIVQGQNDLIAARSALETANKQLALAEKTENRQHELYLAKAGALKDWLQSQTDLAAARNSMRTAEIALAAARNKLRILGKTDRVIKTLEDQPDAQRMQAGAVVAAPISGTVVQRQVGLGQYLQSVSAGANNPVFSIADLSTVWLVANLRETDAGAVRVGQPVEVRVLAYPDRVFSAKITFVSPTVDPNTHRIPVRAEIDNRDGALKPMMFGSFRILTGDVQQAPAVPQSAVVYEGNTAHVFVVRDNGLVEARTIEVGQEAGDMLQVRSGLHAGEKVITSGSLFIDRAAKGNAA